MFLVIFQIYDIFTWMSWLLGFFFWNLYYFFFTNGILVYECRSPQKQVTYVLTQANPHVWDTCVCGSISLLGGFFSTHRQRFRRYRGISWRVLRAFNAPATRRRHTHHSSWTHSTKWYGTARTYWVRWLRIQTACIVHCVTGITIKAGFQRELTTCLTRPCTGIQRATCRDFRDIRAVLFRVQEWSECARISIIIILFSVIDVRRIFFFFLDFLPLYRFPSVFTAGTCRIPIRSLLLWLNGKTLQPLIYTFLFPRITLRSLISMSTSVRRFFFQRLVKSQTQAVNN